MALSVSVPWSHIPLLFLFLKEFFRNLPHWIQQHMDMNDAGNFLIETCDEAVSRDLKQQLLLLNGRWRELFVKVKHVRTRTQHISIASSLLLLGHSTHINNHLTEAKS